MTLKWKKSKNRYGDIFKPYTDLENRLTYTLKKKTLIIVKNSNGLFSNKNIDI